MGTKLEVEKTSRQEVKKKGAAPDRRRRVSGILQSRREDPLTDVEKKRKVGPHSAGNGLRTGKQAKKESRMTVK